MAEYCTSVQPYFHELQARENTARECNIQPYCLHTHQINIFEKSTVQLASVGLTQAHSKYTESNRTSALA